MDALVPLRALVDVLPEAIVLLSPAGEVLHANAPARAALAGRAPGAPPVVGRRLAALSADPPEQLAAQLRAWTRSTSLLPGALRVARADGAPPETFRCDGARVLVRPPDGGRGAPDAATRPPDDPVVVVVRLAPRAHGTGPFPLLTQKIDELTREVARRRAAEEALRQSEAALTERAREAEHANHAKDEFLATLSHELRTPLTAILGWVAMLRQGSLPDERRARALETIERNARAQAQLIEDLLDISAIVSGKLRLAAQPLEPTQVVRAALDAVRPAAEARGVRLEAEQIAPHAGPLVGDASRLQQVCWNLLSNAIKFTPAGGVVRVAVAREDDTVAVTVADTGCGIAPEFLPHVFERFRQQQGGATRSYGGLGLGLAIAHNVVALHGGTITAHSDGEGRGATFTVRLPCARRPADDAAEANAQPSTNTNDAT